MKKIIATFALLIVIASMYSNIAAQNINVNINIGEQPAWGPVGYDYAGYYYFPDIDVYYNVNSGYYNYCDRGRWISARYLPYAYADYDLYRLYKVVLNVNSPWLYNNMHRRDYARYRGYRGQVVIRDSRDARYYNSRNNRVRWYSPNNRPVVRDNRYIYERNYNRPNDNRYYENNRNDNRYYDNSRNDNRYYDNSRNENRDINRPNRQNDQRNNRGDRPGYYNNSPRANEMNDRNRHERRETVRENNMRDNNNNRPERNQTRSDYSSIRYSENRTNNSVGRGR